MPVKLENISSVSPNSSGQIDVPSDLNLVGTSPNPVYRINGVPLSFPQTPWTSDIDAATYSLNNVSAIGIGRTSVGGGGLPLIAQVTRAGPTTIEIRNMDVTTDSSAGFAATANNRRAEFGQTENLGPAGGGAGFGCYIQANIVTFRTGVTERMRIATDGNIGIGLAANPPAYKLDVNGDVNLSAGSVYRINGVPLSFSQTPWTSDIDGANFLLNNVRAIGVGGAAASSADPKIQITGTNEDGLKCISTAPNGYASIVLQNDAGVRAYFALYGSTSNRLLRIQTGNYPIEFMITGLPVIYMSATTNVGIGTNTPTAKLDVYGGTIVRADANGLDSNPGLGQLQVGGLTNLNQRLYMGFDTANNCGVIQPGVAFVGWNNLILNPIGGNVGIGTTTPQVLLDIPAYSVSNSQQRIGSIEFQSVAFNSSVIADNVYYNGSSFTYRNTGFASMLQFINGNLQFRAVGSGTGGTAAPVLSLVTFLNNGNVGIGTATPGSRLSIAGLPTSAAGLSPGDVWNNGGVLNIV